MYTRAAAKSALGALITPPPRPHLSNFPLGVFAGIRFRC